MIPKRSRSLWEAPVAIISIAQQARPKVIGQIDDFRLYNYALSPVEVGQLWVLGGGAGGCMEQLAQDFNGDCAVDLADFAELAAHWMESSLITP